MAAVPVTSPPVSSRVDAEGHVYAAVDSPCRAGVWKFDCRTGEGTRFAGTEDMLFANALAFDDEGTLFVTESFSGMEGDVPLGAIWKITPDGVAEKWLENTALGGPNRFGLAKPNGANGIAFRNGFLYVNVLQQTSIVRVEVRGNGDPGDVIPFVTTENRFINDGLALDAKGRVYVTDVITNGIVRVDPDGTIVPVAGGTEAGFDSATSVAFGVGATAETMYAVNLSDGSFVDGEGPGPALVAVDVGEPGMALPPEPPLQPVASGVDYGADPAEGFGDSPRLDVWAPHGIADASLMVVLRSVPNGPTITSQLAAELASRGNVVFNADWQFDPDRPTASGGGNLHGACAVRYARQHAAEYGGNGDDVIIVGYGAGGVVAATLSLNGDAISGQCSNDETLSATPDGFVGLAGTYDVYSVDPPGLGSIFFEQDPESWKASNPYEQLENADGLASLLIHGELDTAVPLSVTGRLSDALAENGASVSTHVLTGADHRLVLRQWRVHVCDLVVNWLTNR